MRMSFAAVIVAGLPSAMVMVLIALAGSLTTKDWLAAEEMAGGRGMICLL